MRSLKIARSYLRQASARLGDAADAARKGNHPYAVRLSQECVELSLKAALRAVQIDYPRTHEVSFILNETRERFPEWFRSEIGFLRQTSRLLYAKREPSLYGNEAADLSPDEVMGRQDAEDGVKRARKTHKTCLRLVKELEGIQKPRPGR